MLLPFETKLPPPGCARNYVTVFQGKTHSFKCLPKREKSDLRLVKVWSKAQGPNLADSSFIRSLESPRWKWGTLLAIHHTMLRERLQKRSFRPEAAPLISEDFAECEQAADGNSMDI